MHPSVLAQQIRKGLENYLITTFPMATPAFKDAFKELFESEAGMFKGPFVSIELPFAQEIESYHRFLGGKALTHKPYAHQKQAFDRMGEEIPRSTLIATGTGSGKTECFMWPILDHCYRHRKQPGIKAILIYPMNALASDQAKRLAKMISSNPELKGNVRAGLYVGQSDKIPHATMTEEQLITDKEMLRQNPPDILLTNYKMLDYLMIRPKDSTLWKQNTPTTLRFLVIDEMHTFDGAQGTDLACLIRRLKARLETSEGTLCCVGTSATLGDKTSPEKLIQYAEKVFDESFDSQALITEKRQSLEEFLSSSEFSPEDNGALNEELLYELPELISNQDVLDPENYQNEKEYILAQEAFWFGQSKTNKINDKWREMLGDKLIQLSFFRNVLRVLNGKTLSLEFLIKKVAEYDLSFANYELSQQKQLINSLLSLISESKNKKRLPFLRVKLQFWLRELARVVSPISEKAKLAFAHDLSGEQTLLHHPIINCRDCSSTGWLALKDENSGATSSNLDEIYERYFRGDASKLRYIFQREDETAAFDALMSGHYCSGCRQIVTEKNCPQCQKENLLKIYTYSGCNKKERPASSCLFCGSHDGLTIVGSRVASLASVIIGQLFSTFYNKDKKLLAFSDSVQDAAHRASFFGARTFRFNFRAALQQCLERSPRKIRLDEVAKSLIDHWTENGTLEEFVAKFAPPDMELDEKFESLRGGEPLKNNSEVVCHIKKRIEWEILSEYGFMSTIGRTLQRTGCSLAHPCPEHITKVVKEIYPRLVNQQGALWQIEENALRQFLLGMLLQMKSKGGIYTLFLNSYIENLGETYLLNRTPWMPNFGKKAPIFLTHKKVGNRFDALTPLGASASKTWYQNWTSKTIGVVDDWDAFFKLILQGLVEAGFLQQIPTKKETAWGIKESALWISKDVIQFRCEKCSHRIESDITEKIDWENSRCLRFQCSGRYRESPNTDKYYGKWYREGDLERIFPGEHSSLLTRQEREKVEKEFKQEKGEGKPWDINLLSCTPTLEMGIDIGDLSSLILCSIPPSKASFIQRIGRSGRKNGNAFNVVLANARAHDLYFFTEPEELLQGQIDSPDIYLNAQAVLERQLTAYCMDCWVKSGIHPQEIPRFISAVINNLAEGNKGRFPFNFFNYINENRAALLKGFLRLFTKSMTSDSEKHFEEVLESLLTSKILNELRQLQKQVSSIRKKIQSLTTKYNALNALSAKEEGHKKDLKEIQMEKEGLSQLAKSISSEKDTLQFLTETGLLPNYAFPEAGVTLNAVILKEKKSDDSEFYPNPIKFSYERPSQAAISEMAPNNTFYAQGRKVRIDQVDLNVSEIETWRFCNHCSHMELNESSQKCCPSCNSDLWSDEGQKKQLVRLKSVIATARDKNSRLNDLDEERSRTSFLRTMHVLCEKKNVTKAFSIKAAGKTFAFEFIRSAKFCDVNFGEPGPDAHAVEIAGDSRGRKGFQICSKCGKVQTGKEPQHAHTCSLKGKENEKTFLNPIYLYREFTSECIRLLIPPYYGTNLESGEPSFVAALHLGLKKHFGGSIDHLRTTHQKVPIKDGLSATFLFLYDTVPGGTGYLKELTRSPDELIKVLQYALEALNACACNLEAGKDGCYRCLFAFRFSKELETVSRELAKQMLGDILNNKDKVVEITGIETVDLEERLDSELEVKFLEAVDRYYRPDTSVIVRKELVNGKSGRLIHIGSNTWRLEPDYYIKLQDGTSRHVQADFLLTPLKIDGSIEKAQKLRPIAIFTDGFKYHRTIVSDDMCKRKALVDSQKYLTWSLTWHDVISNKNEVDPLQCLNLLDPKEKPKSDCYISWMRQLPGFECFHQLNSLELLFRLLHNPAIEKWQNLAMKQVGLFIDNDPKKLALFKESIPEWLLPTSNNPAAYGTYQHLDRHKNVVLGLFCSMLDGSQISVLCNLNDAIPDHAFDDFRPIWNGYLRLYNIFQFLPKAQFITQTGINQEIYPQPIKEEQEFINEEWQSAIDNTCDDIARSFLYYLAELNAPIPIIGFELIVHKEVLGMAELAWLDKKIVFIPDDCPQIVQAFLHHGWTCLSSEKISNNPYEVAAQIIN